MGFYGVGEKTANSNIDYIPCSEYVYNTSATNINELYGEIKSNGITLTAKDGTVKTYSSLNDTTKDFPNGFIIVRKCPQKIGDTELLESTPVYDNNGFLIRYNCKYNCKLCNNVKGCGSLFCIGFSQTIIGCIKEDKCNYYSTTGSEVTEEQISNMNCDCEDPIWVTKKEGDTFVVKSYSRKTGKECSNSELLENNNVAKCGDVILIRKGINYISDPDNNGIILDVNIEDVDEYNDCQIFQLYVNDTLVKTSTILELREYPLTIDITPYNIYGTYKIEYKVI